MGTLCVLERTSHSESVAPSRRTPPSLLVFTPGIFLLQFLEGHRYRAGETLARAGHRILCQAVERVSVGLKNYLNPTGCLPDEMTRRLPPLNPLRVFEVVARTGNLTVAAQELHVTQSAVSRQIAVLEKYVGIDLFRRERHGVTLTRRGADYAREVIPAFERIAAATERLVRAPDQGVLRLRTYTTFAAKWLIPRLPDFERSHPGIDVRIMNAVADVDFDRDKVDVAIQYGAGRWPHQNADLLFQDEIEPICAPRFVREHQAARQPAKLLSTRLLVSRYRHQDWDDWLTANDLVDVASRTERMSFNTSILTWQAAVDGLGIAIGQTALLQHEFRQGLLIRPFVRPLWREQGHYLVRPAVQRESREVRAFRDWLLATAAAERTP